MSKEQNGRGSTRSSHGGDDSLSGSRRGSYSLINTASVAKLVVEEDPKAPVVVSEVTSEVYSEDSPPRDWADIGLLIPHEAIRREMTGMERSVDAMPESLDATSAWKGKYFARWYIEYFYQSVHDHHDNEEELYFPWIATKADLPEKLTQSHVELVEAMDVIKGHCETILKKDDDGYDCASEIAGLKKSVPDFVSNMRAHLKEEEEVVPTLLRTHFTHQEEEEVVQKILQKGGMDEVRAFLPSILLAMKEWAAPEFYNDFVGSMPPPVSGPLLTKFLPDYDTFVHPMRDAPTMDSEPKLTQKPNEDDGAAGNADADAAAPAQETAVESKPEQTKPDVAKTDVAATGANAQSGCCIVS